jgi:HAD superfamily hydrolase (TIGR01490 family)
MDKTLLRVESGTSWVRYQYKLGKIPLSTVAKALYWSTLHKLAVLDMDVIFGRLVASLKGQRVADMIEESMHWYHTELAPQVVPAALVAIEHHRRAGHPIVLATGSTQYAAAPVAKGVGIDHVLSSVLEVDEGLFTGRYTALGFGHHKVALAEQWALRHGIDLESSYFYSDSYTDLPMMERVGTAVAINPDTRLLRHAKWRGWRVRTWA